MDLHARAAVLAALADPARLQIVDILSAGDASPSELRAHLDTTSNLLAHHLGVLEGRGIVSRHNSGRGTIASEASHRGCSHDLS